MKCRFAGKMAGAFSSKGVELSIDWCSAQVHPVISIGVSHSGAKRLLNV